jgi:hypothetical protein
MIAKHDTHLDKIDIWSALAAPLPPMAIQWRQQGKPVTRDGRHIARFVGYIDAQFVQERFDSVVPGEWDSHLDQLPNVTTFDGEDDAEPFAFKCRLQVLGVIREDVGQGRDYKTAATDAFKRAAVRFGIGRELYALQPNWVQMDGDGKYAKPVEDPAVAYARRYGGKAAAARTTTTVAPRPVTDGQEEYGAVPESARGEMASGSDDIGATARPSDEQICPKCGGRCFDNRAENDARAARGEKLRPDWKCRARECDGVIWREKKTATRASDNEIPV